VIYYWTLKLAVVVIFVIGNTPFLQAQTSDFFSNTQSNGKLAASASGCPTGATCSANAPGFNPTDLVNHADPNATITGAPTIPGETRPFFSQLGPGAITDNMFGVISKIHPGVDTTPTITADDDPTICGLLPGDVNIGLGVTPDSVGSNGSSLNCGDLRFDPASQGQTIPAFPLPPPNNITSASGDVTFINDFNPSTDDHIGFNLTNNLVFNPTQTSNTQQMRQVTALTAGGTAATVGSPGTEAAPGTGDQVVEIDTSWPLTTQSSTSTPTITWSMTLDDLDPLTPGTLTPDQTDSINTMGSLVTDSSFTYNTGAFPSTIIPAPCWWSGCDVGPPGPAITSETIAIPKP